MSICSAEMPLVVPTLEVHVTQMICCRPGCRSALRSGCRPNPWRRPRGLHRHASIHQRQAATATEAIDEELLRHTHRIREVFRSAARRALGQTTVTDLAALGRAE
jgi:hypothetical protein